MYHALMLIPTAAEAYSYWPIVAKFDFDTDDRVMKVTSGLDNEKMSAILDGTYEPKLDHFLWGVSFQLVDASRITKWSVIRVESDTKERVEYLTDYQSGRLWSGIHPHYIDTVLRDDDDLVIGDD